MKLLIVDDEVIAIEGIKGSVDFAKHGIIKVFSARSMSAAQEIIRQWGIDIVLCDIEMPGGSGLELIEWINREYPNIVTIILSCHSDFDFAKQAVNLSCLQYLLKPAVPEELDAALERAVEKVNQEAANLKYRKLGEGYLQSIAGSDTEKADVMQVVECYIREHVDEELSVEKLAQIAYISPNYLTRCFKKKHGKTVVEYINDFRLGLAEEMLKNTSLTVTAISAKVGYANYSYFVRQFKKYKGCSPSEYRT